MRGNRYGDGVRRVGRARDGRRIIGGRRVVQQVCFSISLILSISHGVFEILSIFLPLSCASLVE